MIAIHESSGRISAIYNVPDGDLEVVLGTLGQDLSATIVPAGVGHDTHYMDAGVAVEYPDKPGDFHTWDWTSKSWVGNVAVAITSKTTAVASQFNARNTEPVAYYGDVFDADAVARENINGTIDYIDNTASLPAGWVGWRSASNAMRWSADDAATVRAHLVNLRVAIADRKQGLYVAAWQHKAAITSLTTVEDVLSYDINTGWPE